MQKVLALVLALVLVVCVFAGCAAKDTTPADTTPAQTTDTADKAEDTTGDAAATTDTTAEEGEEIVIGVTGPMTGAAALNGQYMTNATTMAADEWNAKGGVVLNDGKSHKVKLVFEDDQATASVALNAVTKQIYTNNVFALIGPHNSGCVLSVADMCTSENHHAHRRHLPEDLRAGQ